MKPNNVSHIILYYYVPMWYNNVYSVKIFSIKRFQTFVKKWQYTITCAPTLVYVIFACTQRNDVLRSFRPNRSFCNKNFFFPTRVQTLNVILFLDKIRKARRRVNRSVRNGLTTTDESQHSDQNTALVLLLKSLNWKILNDFFERVRRDGDRARQHGEACPATVTAGRYMTDCWPPPRSLSARGRVSLPGMECDVITA